MSVMKVVENGYTYRVETIGETVVRMKVDPFLRYAEVPRTVAVGDVVSIPMHLEEFDGTRLHDTIDVTFAIDREPVPMTVTDGELTLELELTARGRHTIAVVPAAIDMEPIEIHVV